MVLAHLASEGKDSPIRTDGVRRAAEALLGLLERRTQRAGLGAGPQLLFRFTNIADRHRTPIPIRCYLLRLAGRLHLLFLASF